MTGERARRTSSGSTLRLVGQGGAATGAAAPEGAAADGAADPDGTGGAPASTRRAGTPPHLVAESIVLPGQRQSVGLGRHWVVGTAAEHGVTGMANQVVELLTSEILANAVLHGGEGASIGVEVAHGAGVVRISVTDAGPRGPVVLRREPAAPSGRGMAIVEAMSSRWGVDEDPEGGKTVWFELDLEDF